MGVAREVDELVGRVFSLHPAQMAEFLCKVEVRGAEEAFAAARASLPDPERCPHCLDPRLTKRGRDSKGRQRWLCGGCGSSFTADTGCVVSRSHLPEATWAAFCRAFAARATLRECAEECGVSLKTAWYMRVRVCGMLRREGAARPVAGRVVQGDEAFLPESFSGNHTRNADFEPARAPRRRGGGDTPKECLLTLVGEGATCDFRVADAGRRAEAAERQVEEALGRLVKVECEMASSVGSAAARLGHEVARSYSGDRRLNPLNAVHSAMRSFVDRFRGLSSRRMQMYLDWFAWHSGFRGPGASSRRLSALLALVPIGRWKGSRAALFREEYPAEKREASRRSEEMKRHPATSKVG